VKAVANDGGFDKPLCMSAINAGRPLLVDLGFSSFLRSSLPTAPFFAPFGIICCLFSSKVE